MFITLADTVPARHSVRLLVASIIATAAFSFDVARADIVPVCLASLPSTPSLNAANQPAQVAVLGTMFPHSIVGPAALGMPPADPSGTWSITFDLSGKYSEFQTLAAVGDRLPSCSAVFSVVADGKTLYKSPIQHSGDEPGDVDIDVNGVQHMTLTVTAVGGSPFPKSVIWADPELAPAAGTPASPPLSPVPAQGSAAASNPSPTMGSNALDPNVVLVVPFAGNIFGSPDASDQVTSAIISQIQSDTGKIAIPLGQAKEILAKCNGGNPFVGYLDREDIAVAAESAGAQWIVMGTVGVFQVETHQEVMVQKHRATVAFIGKLVDASSSNPAIRAFGTGKVDGTSISPGGVHVGDSGSDLLNRAIQAAVKQFTTVIDRTLAPAGGGSK